MLSPFSNHSEQYRVSIEKYIRKTYPLLHEIFGDIGIQQITKQELNTTKNIYEKLPYTIAVILLKNPDIRKILYTQFEQSVDKVLPMISQMPDTHPEAYKIASSMSDDILRTLAKENRIDVYMTHKLLRGRSVERKCPFTAIIRELIKEVLS